MSKPLNILYIIDYFHRTGGTERHLADLVQHLPKDRFNCSVVVFDLGPNVLIDDMRSAGVTVTHVPVAREYALNAMIQARKLSGIIKSGNIDIVQTFHQKSDTYGAVVAKLSGVRHLISSKRDIGDLKKRHHLLANRILTRVFSRYIVVADAVADVVVQSEGVTRSRITRIYNGVDATTWSPATKSMMQQERSRLGFDDEDFVVGMVAGFRPEKNHDMLFTAALQAMKVIPNLKVLAVGDGPLLQGFRARYAAEIAQGNFIFPGAVDDVASYLHSMDTGCLIPGENEGFSNAILEKMAVGLPLIVSDVGGNAEAVIDGENGLVIAPNDEEATSQALIDISSDRERRLRMGRMSRRRVEENFTLERMCKEHADLYSSLYS